MMRIPSENIYFVHDGRVLIQGHLIPTVMANGWYFADEIGEFSGPYDSQYAAEHNLAMYCRNYLGYDDELPVTVNWSKEGF